MANEFKTLPVTAHQQMPFSRPPTPRAHPLQIGFYGLGTMGYIISRNLANHQFSHPVASPPLLVFNRTMSKCEKLVEEVGENKVRIAPSAAQLAIESDVIITCLANDDTVKSVYAEFSEALTQTPPTKTKIFVETSTIYPTVTGELDSVISQIPHAHLIACPVFGAPFVADQAQLVLAMSGDYRCKKEIAYLLVPAIGRKVYDFGGNVEKAHTFKLIGNSMILGLMEVLAETQTFAEKAGIGAEAAQNFIKDFLPVPGPMGYGNKMLNDLFDGTKGFAIDGAIKDASHIHRLACELNSPMPVIDTARQHLLTARALHSAEVAQGKQRFDTLDVSAIVAGTRVAAGLDGLDSRKHSKVVKDD